MKTWQLADDVVGGRSHHSLLMLAIMRVSLQSGIYIVFLFAASLAGIMK